MRRELRIEPDIDAIDAIVEFQIAEQRRLRPDIADVEQFAPAVMADDDVRLESELLQIAGRPRHGVRAPHRRVQLPRGDVRLRRGRPWLSRTAPSARPESGSRSVR